MSDEEKIETLGEHDVIAPGAFGTGKKTVPLYWGDRDDPNRKLIGTCEVDLDTRRLMAERAALPDAWPHRGKRAELRQQIQVARSTSG